jgi:hypothetical protein
LQLASVERSAAALMQEKEHLGFFLFQQLPCAHCWLSSPSQRIEGPDSIERSCMQEDPLILRCPVRCNDFMCPLALKLNDIGYSCPPFNVLGILACISRSTPYVRHSNIPRKLRAQLAPRQPIVPATTHRANKPQGYIRVCSRLTGDIVKSWARLNLLWMASVCSLFASVSTSTSSSAARFHNVFTGYSAAQFAPSP